MAIVDQKERYRRQAALCYEIAATMDGERAISMIRLGDTYAALATACCQTFLPHGKNMSIRCARNADKKCN